MGNEVDIQPYRSGIVALPLMVWRLAFVAEFGTQIFNLKTKFYMVNNTSINRENGNDANRLLAAGKIVVVKFLKGDYVIRVSDHDKETMLAFYNNGNMREATKDEREYWCHAYATTDYHGVSLTGLQEWLKWKSLVACH